MRVLGIRSIICPKFFFPRGLGNLFSQQISFCTGKQEKKTAILQFITANQLVVTKNRPKPVTLHVTTHAYGVRNLLTTTQKICTRPSGPRIT